jgi:hypothetical protein
MKEIIDNDEQRNTQNSLKAQRTNETLRLEEKKSWVDKQLRSKVGWKS